MSSITVALIDDHAVLRGGLRMLISAQPDMAVVAEAGGLREGIEAVRRTRPHVVVLDLSMPDSPGLGGIDRLLVARPDAKVLVLTMHEDPALVRSAMERGAKGYVFKASADSRLIEAIRAVAGGGTFCEAAQARGVPASPPSGAVAVRPELAAILESLSDRERDVLARVARGQTSREIAEALALSIKTVESYRARAMHKLGMESRADLMRIALESGLLQEPPLQDS